MLHNMFDIIPKC